jgi:hypothetical protein
MSLRLRTRKTKPLINDEIVQIILKLMRKKDEDGLTAYYNNTREYTAAELLYEEEKRLYEEEKESSDDSIEYYDDSELRITLKHTPTALSAISEKIITRGREALEGEIKHGDTLLLDFFAGAGGANEKTSLFLPIIT